MADDHVTDDHIEAIVAFVENAEIMAETMDVKVSVAARWMMKSAQLTAKKGNPFEKVVPQGKHKM